MKFFVVVFLFILFYYYFCHGDVFGAKVFSRACAKLLRRLPHLFGILINHVILKTKAARKRTGWSCRGKERERQTERKTATCKNLLAIHTCTLSI